MTARAAAGRPLVVPVFLPHAGCPHRCVFCNQSAITGAEPLSARPDPDRIARQIESFLAASRPRSLVHIAFYGGNFLGQTPQTVQELLGLAGAYVSGGTADGIRFSTRPDTVEKQHLDAVAPFPVDTVEIGAQSLDDRVLIRSRRGHSASDTAAAVGLLKSRGYRVGLQLMIGLPGQSKDSALASAAQAAALAPDFVRIYPALVLAGSPLARWYRRGRYRPLRLKTAVSLTAQMVGIFSEQCIPVVRMGLQATEDIRPGSQVLDGPCHPAFGELVRSAVWLQQLQDALLDTGENGKLRIWVHPRTESQVRGQNNQNIALLKKRYSLQTISVIKENSLDPETVRIEAGEKLRRVLRCGPVKKRSP
ncbi:MAG: radical SAM protein [Desulfobacterales bacterium]|nr:radical SAM protein [Desulfobacterales bacterium]